MNGLQNIAFWTKSVSHLNHEIKALNIWLVFIRLIKIQKILFFINRLKRLNRLRFLTSQPSLEKILNDN
jgi:hypothetical protein